MKIGIRREDKTPSEARVPVVPEHVGRLIREHGLRVRVQPAVRRVFKDNEFVEYGAEVAEDLREFPIILGVKEIPIHIFEPGKTYIFFSHTIKGQKYNMSMLRRMMDLGCNLIDYETIVDAEGQRLVAFGYHAGLAGMVNTLWSLGRRLAVEGRPTPLAQFKQAHRYESLAAAKAHLAELASQIVAEDSLAGMGPVVCGITGYGRVSRGAQEVYDVVAPREVTPAELAKMDPKEGDGRFYKVVFKEEDMVRPLDPAAGFNLKDYYSHPEKYVGVFGQYLPHLTCMVNCVYWESKYPRLVTLDDIQRLYGGGARPKLKVIGDISCDVGGSVECLVRPTDPANPVYVYDVRTRAAVDGFEGEGPVIMGVEILPTELPRESSSAFSNALVELLPGLAKADPSGDFENWNLPAPLKRAVILHKGKLTPKFAHLAQYVREG